MAKDYSELPIQLVLTAAQVELVLKYFGTGPLHEVFPLYQAIQTAQLSAIEAARKADAETPPPPNKRDKKK